MNRRKFLSRLGIGAAVATVACVDPWCDSIAGEGIIPHDELHLERLMQRPNIGEYADYESYTNFSSLVVQSSIDEIVSNAAIELGKAAGLEISRRNHIHGFGSVVSL